MIYYMRAFLGLERRKKQRRLVFVQGKVCFSKRCHVKCVVQNLSEDGAKITFALAADLPYTLKLVIDLPDGQPEYLAVTRWRKKRSVGVELLNRAEAALASRFILVHD